MLRVSNQHPVPPKKSKRELALAIASLLGELERVRREFVVKQETASEIGAKIDALKRIATEKFRSQMTEFNAALAARKCPQNSPLPDPNDLPEEHEIQLLWNSLQRTNGLPVIDPQVRMALLWLSSDPLAKIVLDELDRLKLLSRPSLDNVNRMITFLAKFPGAGTQREALEQTPSGQIRHSVADVYGEGLHDGIKLTHKDLCERLDARKINLPPNAKWKRLNSWVAAWKDRKSRSSVSKWLSEATRGERRMT